MTAITAILVLSGVVAMVVSYPADQMDRVRAHADNADYLEKMKLELRQDVAAKMKLAMLQEMMDKANIEEYLGNGLAKKQSCEHRYAECGGPGWRKVVDLDPLGNRTHECPPSWQTVTLTCSSGLTGLGCASAFFPVSGESYSRVCGRVVGVGLGAGSNPDAFDASHVSQKTIDNPYLDGVSITHGSPRQHVFSFAAGHGPDIFVDGVRISSDYRCPCDNDDRSFAPLPPSFVGDNYFCDGEYNELLWDGMDCTTACCTANSPPYFSVDLLVPTSDDIEVRMCHDQSDDSFRVIEIQLYVQ